MKFALITVLLASSHVPVSANKAPGNALDKVREMLGNLKDKINAENEREKEFNEHWLTWCAEQKKVLSVTLKLKTEERDEADATITRSQAEFEEAEDKISDLVKSLAKNQGSLDSSTELRQNETKEFLAAQDELNSAIVMLGKAISVIGSEVKKNPASLAQMDTKMFNQLLSTFSTIMDAAALPSNDKEDLVSLIQSVQEGSEDAVDAPASTVFKSSSGGILEILENMKEKAETDLDRLQKAEMEAKHNFKLMKAQLEYTIRDEKTELREQKVAQEQAKEELARAQRTFDLSKAAIVDLGKTLEDLKVDCRDWRRDYETFQEDQEAELHALTMAQQAIANAVSHVSGSAQIQVASNSSDSDELDRLREDDENDNDDPSFLQVRKDSVADGAKIVSIVKDSVADGAKIVSIVKALAHRHHSAALNQLASRIRTTFRYAAVGGEDPFAKVKGLISAMISKLEANIRDETTEQVFCNKSMTEAEETLEALGVEIEKLDSDYQTSYAEEIKMTDNLHATEEHMASVTKSFTTLQGLFYNETKEFYTTESEMKAGLAAVRSTMKILRSFYGISEPEEAPITIQPAESWHTELPTQSQSTTEAAEVPEELPPEAQAASFLQVNTHAPAEDIPELKSEKNTVGATGIVDLLTIIEDDLAKSLTELQKKYEDSKRNYEKEEADYKMEKIDGEGDITRYGVGRTAAHRKSDEINVKRHDKADEKTAAVAAYFKLKDRCIMKPEKYEDRRAKRKAEIEGLKGALQALEEEAAPLIQTRSSGRGLRGAAPL